MLTSGKMLDSVERLRERLENIDPEQITDAIERLALIREQLLVLQKNLTVVAAASLCHGETLRAQEHIVDDLNRLQREIPRRPLSANGSEPGLTFGATAAVKEAVDADVPHSDLVSATAGGFTDDDFNRTLIPASPIMLQTTHSEDTDQVFTPTEAISAEQREESLSVGASVLDDPTISSLEAPESSNEYIYSESLEQPLITVDREEVAYQIHETSPTIAAEEFIERCEPQFVSSRPHETAPAGGTTTVEFDTKLLDDLIKNYGEFIVSPQVPAEAEAKRPSSKSHNRSQSRVGSEPEQASDKNAVSYSSHGELDRKLKKLIKDYGEVDLYSQRSWIKTKLRAIGAFGVLGVVLSGIYFFSAPKANLALKSPPAPLEEIQSSASESSGGTKASVESPNPMAATTATSGSFAVEVEPSSQKKNKKGGVHQ